MSLDPYALCPCGSGKKLKFCCADLAGDIEKIHHMITGEQPHAALRHVEQALERLPGRASLLDLQAMLEISLNELEKAETTVQVFLQAHPHNPSALADQALLFTKTSGGRAAVAPLQQALFQIDGNMPQRVLEAIGAVGHALLVEGHVVAAQAHLWLYTAIAGTDDRRALELLINLNRVSGLPIMLRDRLRLCDWPVDATWKSTAEEAVRLADLGRWQQAVAILDELGQKYGADPALIYNRAVLGGWLGDEKALVAGLHVFAQLEVPYDAAVEAEAIAQLLDAEQKDPIIESVSHGYEIHDIDALENLFHKDGRVELYAGSEEFQTGDGPPPRKTYLLLDCAAPQSGVEITRDEIPSVLGFLGLYGRQTDQSERLVLHTHRGEQFDKTIAVLKEVGGAELGDLASEEVTGQTTTSQEALSWRWHFPRDTPPSRRRELLTEERTKAILERWPNVARAALNGKSPRDAASDEKLSIPLAAAVFILEQGTSNFAHADAIARLRQSLDLPLPGKITPGDIAVASLPLVRVPRLEIADVSDDDLVQLYRRAMIASGGGAMAVLASEVVRRPSLEDKIPLDEAYQQLIAVAPDPARALELIHQARTRAEQAGKTIALWDIAELELQLAEGNVEGVKKILGEIDQRHGDNAEVSAAVYQLLYEAGVLQPEDVAPMSPAAQPTTPTAEMATGPADPARIWTPGDDAPSAGKSSKIWTPS